MAAFAVQKATPSRSRQISAAPRRAYRGFTSRSDLPVVSRPYLAALRRPRCTQPRWACACSLSSPSPSSPSPFSKARASTNLSGSRRPRQISPAARRAHRAPATPAPLPPDTANPSDAPPALLILPTVYVCIYMRMRGAATVCTTEFCLLTCLPAPRKSQSDAGAHTDRSSSLPSGSAVFSIHGLT